MKEEDIAVCKKGALSRISRDVLEYTPIDDSSVGMLLTQIGNLHILGLIVMTIPSFRFFKTNGFSC